MSKRGYVNFCILEEKIEMHIVIYGTGGVGGYFGARLAESGNKVAFIARGAHLQAMRQNGLKVISSLGDSLIQPVSATDTISEVKDIDLIFVCTKTWQVPEIAKELKQVVSDKTVVIPLLNGVENHENLLKELPRKNVMAGLCKIVSKIEAPGVVKHWSYTPTIEFGELSNEHTERAKAIDEVIKAAGIKSVLADDIYAQMWMKFLYISTVSALGGLTRATIGEMRSHPKIRAYMYNLADEILAIAAAKGIQLPDQIKVKQFAIIDQQPFDTTASLQRDIMAGRPSELEAQQGTIVRLGKELNVPTPVNEFVYNCLLPQEEKARQ